MAGWTPTFVVGIDFGMTCTGVAYSSTDYNWADPRVIQKWPVRGRKLLNKYPSRVGYDDMNRPLDWGECNMSDRSLQVEREFKLYLDPGFSDHFEDSPSHEQAVQYYKDYMSKLFHHLQDTFRRTIRGWDEHKVEYIFSIPTTWKHPTLSVQLTQWLAAAGFVNSDKIRVVISKTEAEAAAVYAAKHYQTGDIIMVVDAGGATTDVNLLEVTEKEPLTRLIALDQAEGENAGSVLIDTTAKKLIASRLQTMGMPSDEQLMFLAEDMMERSDFEGYKCEYDGDSGYLAHHLPVPDSPGSEVVINALDLKRLFEPLISKLVNVIQAQLSSLSRRQPNRPLRYIVLSGGLGSSEYVQKRLKAKFCYAQTTPSSSDGIQILVAAEPQLAVVKGLVMDRTQALCKGKGIYTGKRSRVSYGVLCRQEYDESLHLGQPVKVDPQFGGKWVENQIDWLIRKGQVVKDEGFKRRYGLKVSKGDEYEPIYAYLVMSEEPATQLPDNKNSGTIKNVCTVTGQFMRDDFKNFEVKKRLIHRDRKHYETEFDLRVLVGSTDLTFELVSLDGRKYNRDEARVDVVWDSVPISKSTSSRETTAKIYPKKR